MGRLTPQKYTYVISASGQPLMPTTRQGHVRRLLNAGKARITSHVPYTIQLKYDTDSITQPMHGGLRPGRDNISASVITNNGEEVFRCHLTTRNREIAKLMAERRQHRQASRRGERLVRKRLGQRYGTTFNGFMERILPGCEKPVKVKDIINTEARFNNRTRPAGWVTPTVRQLIQTHMSLIRKVCKLLPITDWSVQVDKHSFMILDNGMVWGSDFCNGRMKGYKSVKDYVRARQGGKCIICGKPIEHFHHVIPRHLDGSDLPENIVGLCKTCHEGIHTDKIQTALKGKFKKYASLSALNQAMPFILKEMVSVYGKDGISAVSHTDVTAHMADNSIDRSTAIASMGSGIVVTDPSAHCFELRQFRRHDRQLIKSQRERTYKLDGVTVAKNRTPRFEQPKDMPALSTWYENEVFAKGKALADTVLSRITVTKSKRYYNNPHRLMPGARFMYQGKSYILSGSLSNSSYYRAYGDTRTNYPAGKSSLLRHNTGIVFIS